MGRLADVRDQIERGEHVDFGRVLALQAADQAIADETFVEDARVRQEEADREIEGHA